MLFYCFFSSRRRHTRCALVTGVQTLCSSDLDEAELYRLATDTLVALHQRWWPDVPGLPSYDTERLLAEVALLVDWYLPAMSGRETPPAQQIGRASGRERVCQYV